MSSEQAATDPVAEPSGTAPAPESKSGRGLSSRWFLLIGAVILVDIAAFILFPPFPKGGVPGEPCSFPVCFIESTLHFPAPHTVWREARKLPAATVGTLSGGGLELREFWDLARSPTAFDGSFDEAVTQLDAVLGAWFGGDFVRGHQPHLYPSTGAPPAGEL